MEEKVSITVRHHEAYLAHGLRWLTRDTKGDVDCLQQTTQNDVRNGPSYIVNFEIFNEIIEILFKTTTTINF